MAKAEDISRAAVAATLGAGLGSGLSASIGGDTLTTGASAVAGATTLGTLAYLISRKLNAKGPKTGPVTAGVASGTVGTLTGAAGGAATGQLLDRAGKTISSKAGMKDMNQVMRYLKRIRFKNSPSDNVAVATAKSMGRGAIDALDYLRGIGIRHNITGAPGLNANGGKLPLSKTSKVVGTLLRKPGIGVGLGTGALAALASYKFLRDREQL